ncbi:hypothetical protein [Bradyrhizobium sp. ARR65]|uniref:hypothetical protein n=1 Tax=Bradyrhizobium sp. ARR65 TaxID=1040989 RepID=UPI0006885C35|nr:hypothetical protein [Bradyrhizobium sp. ARR65]
MQAKSGWTNGEVRYILLNITTHRTGHMEMEFRAFTEAEIAADGSVALGFVDESGNPVKVRLSIDQVGALAMTLPDLIATALRNHHGNAKMRFAYPLTSWRVEQSKDFNTSMMTLNAPDGFSVCFSMRGELRRRLGETFAAEQFSSLATLAH